MIPKYVYHYTSIDTLKKIVESKKIRFTRVDKLNDPYEGIHQFENLENYSGEARKLIYCSCWTDLKTESVNLWYIYTKMKGVRIKMKSALFADTLKLKELKSGFIPYSEIEPINCNFLLNQNATQINKIYGPFKIEYVNELSDTYKHAISHSIANQGRENEFQMNDIDLHELGIKKINHWQYENEWRFKINPFETVQGGDEAFKSGWAYGIINPEYIDIPYKSAIEEILLGPEVSEVEKMELEKYLSQSNLNIPLQKSEIQVRITEQVSLKSE